MGEERPQWEWILIPNYVGNINKDSYFQGIGQQFFFMILQRWEELQESCAYFSGTKYNTYNKMWPSL
jgi:hypothetical protein